MADPDIVSRIVSAAAALTSLSSLIIAILSYRRSGLRVRVKTVVLKGFSAKETLCERPLEITVGLQVANKGSIEASLKGVHFTITNLRIGYGTDLVGYGEIYFPLGERTVPPHSLSSREFDIEVPPGLQRDLALLDSRVDLTNGRSCKSRASVPINRGRKFSWMSLFDEKHESLKVEITRGKAH